jgi:hypothetical protein
VRGQRLSCPTLHVHLQHKVSENTEAKSTCLSAACQYQETERCLLIGISRPDRYHKFIPVLDRGLSQHQAKASRSTLTKSRLTHRHLGTLRVRQIRQHDRPRGDSALPSTKYLALGVSPRCKAYDEQRMLCSALTPAAVVRPKTDDDAER